MGEGPATWTTSATYRGQPMETRHHGTRLEVRVATHRREELLGALGGYPVHSVSDATPTPA